MADLDFFVVAPDVLPPVATFAALAQAFAFGSPDIFELPEVAYPDMVLSPRALITYQGALSHVPAVAHWPLDQLPPVHYDTRLPHWHHQSGTALPVGALTSFGFDNLAQTVRGSFIPSTEQFFQSTVAGPVIGAFIPSTEQFFQSTVSNAGLLRVARGGQGPVSGGQQLELRGQSLDVTALNDDFANTVGPLWTTVVVGSALARADAGLWLDTGSTPGSSVAVRSVATVTDVDVQVQIDVRNDPVPKGAELLFGLGLRVSATSSVRLDVVRSDRGTLVRGRIEADGAPTDIQTVNVSSGRAPLLRLIRLGGRVLGLLNGTVFFDGGYTTTAANIEFRAANDPVISSRIVGKLIYLRRPLIALGDEPVTDFVYGRAGLYVVRAPRGRVIGVADIYVLGGAAKTLPAGYLYLRGGLPIIGSFVLRNEEAGGDSEGT